MEPLVLAGLGVVVGAGLAPWVPVGAPVTATLVAVGAGLMGLGARRPGAAIAGLALGLLAVLALPPGPELSGRVTLQGVVVGASTGMEADVAVSRWAPPSTSWQEAEGRVRVRFPSRPPTPGTAVLLRGKAVPVRRPVLPGAPDPVRNAARTRVQTLVRAERVERIGAPSAPDRRFEGVEHGGLLRALTTGDRSAVAEETTAVLRGTGTAHLLAISGFHVGLVAMGVGTLARSVFRVVGVVRERGLGDAPALWVGAGAGLLYAATVGAPASAQRAAGLVLLLAVARGRGAHLKPLSALAGVGAILVLLDPAMVGTPGFQLSFGAVLGLVRVTPRLTAWLPPDLPRIVDWPLRSVAVTLGATVGALPATAWWFQQIAPWSPVANLVAMPWVAFAVVPCAAGAAWAPEPLAGLALVLGDRAVAVLLAVLGPLATRPLAPAVGGAGALLLAVPLLVPRRTLIALAFGLLAVGPPRVVPQDLRITFLDVGQGDAMLVEHADGRRWLVDGGPGGDRVLKWLRRRGVRRIDALIASHGHADHTAGLLAVLEGLEVGAVWVPDREGLEALLTLAVERRVPVLRRPPPSITANARLRSLNDRSLVLVLEHEGRRVVLPGDVEAEAEAVLARAIGGPVDLLKVPHHGSRSSSTQILLDALRPRIAVLSAGAGNVHGHPHAAVLQRYARHDVTLYRTDQEGTVEVLLGEEGVRVRTKRGGEGWRAPALLLP